MKNNKQYTNYIMFESAIKIYKHSNRDWECVILNVGRLYWENNSNEEIKNVSQLCLCRYLGEESFRERKQPVQNLLDVGSSG